MKNEKVIKYLVCTAVLVTGIITNYFSLAGENGKVYAEVDTITVNFSKDTDRTRSKTITIPNLVRMIDKSVDTGDVDVSVNGGQVTVSVSNGRIVDSYTPSKYISRYEVYTGQDFPPSSYYYNVGSYSGYLSRVDQVNDMEIVEETEGKLFEREKTNTVIGYYDAEGNLIEITYSWGNSNDHPTLHIDEDGYVGDIPKIMGYKSRDERFDNEDGSYRIEQDWVGVYRGTLEKTVIKLIDHYTGYYSGWVESDYTYDYYAYTVTLEYEYNSSPSLEVIKPVNNEVISELDADTIPVASISDPDGDMLYCKAYIDGILHDQPPGVSNTFSSQTISFKRIDAANLSEGSHTLRIEVDDGIDTVAWELVFKVDTAPPVIDRNSILISSTDMEITIQGNASDAIAGLAEPPYLFETENNSSGWINSNPYTFKNMTPNTIYDMVFKARDSEGHVASEGVRICTKAQKPEVSKGEITPYGMELIILDENPAETKYMLKCGSGYIDSDGRITGTPDWIEIPGKSMGVKGLAPNTEYSFRIKAKNRDGVDTSYSDLLKAGTLAMPPGNIAFEPSQHNIIVNWQPVPDVTGYELYADGNIIKGIVSCGFTHEGLMEETLHTYKVRTVNETGPGLWSSTYSVWTLPYPPDTPVNLTAEENIYSIRLTWSAVPGAEEYVLEQDGNKIYRGGLTEFLHEELAPDNVYTYRVKACNAGGDSEWSSELNTATLPIPPDTPENITYEVTKYSVTLQWDSMPRAELYQVKDERGSVIYDGEVNSFTHSGLEPASAYSYSVRALNRGGASQWSVMIDAETYPEKPAVPANIMATSEKDKITLTWHKVLHGEFYEVEIDGGSPVAVEDTRYVHTGLGAGESHTYRIRAVNISGESPWSRPVNIETLPDISDENMTLTNVAAIVTNSFITLSWDDMGLSDTGYSVEVDGVLMDNGGSTIFHHTGLEPSTNHMYKIRMNDESSDEKWCAVLVLSTLPDPPDAITDIQVQAYETAIELRWERVAGAEGYDIEVDGQVMDNENENTYRHEELEPGTTHTYRVRPKNITGTAAWSTSIIKSTLNPEYTVACTKGQEFELSLLAFNVQDFSNLVFRVEYNSDELEIAGINGLDGISCTYRPGRVEISVDKRIVPGSSWSGEFCSITFIPGITGETNIRYIAE